MSHGWRARIGTQPASSQTPVSTGDSVECRHEDAVTFSELVAALPSKVGTKKLIEVKVALPARLVVFERLTLPSVDPQELAGMVRLQLEKTLPYSVDETTSGYQVLSRREAKPAATETAGDAEPSGAENAEGAESVVLACVVHNSAVNTFCAPLVQRRQFPQRLTLWAMHVATQAPPFGVACALWQEEADTVFAIFENRTLSFVEVISSPDHLLEDMPQVLMSAELAGAPVTFCAVLLDPALSDLREPLRDFLGASCEDLRLEELHDVADPGALVDLTLDSWRAELARMEQAHRLRMRLAGAGLAYAALMLLVIGYLGLLGHRLKTVQSDLAAVQPQVDTVLAQQARWKSLQPAVDPQRYTVELLYQVFQSMPSPDVRITQFDQSPSDFRVQGEAPDANQAITLEEKLKAQPELSQYQFEAGNPTLLSNDHAQFSISGKL